MKHPGGRGGRRGGSPGESGAALRTLVAELGSASPESAVVERCVVRAAADGVGARASWLFAGERAGAPPAARWSDFADGGPADALVSSTAYRSSVADDEAPCGGGLLRVLRRGTDRLALWWPAGAVSPASGEAALSQALDLLALFRAHEAERRRSRDLHRQLEVAEALCGADAGDALAQGCRQLAALPGATGAVVLVATEAGFRDPGDGARMLSSSVVRRLGVPTAGVCEREADELPGEWAEALGSPRGGRLLAVSLGVGADGTGDDALPDAVLVVATEASARDAASLREAVGALARAFAETVRRLRGGAARVEELERARERAEVTAEEVRRARVDALAVAAGAISNSLRTPLGALHGSLGQLVKGVSLTPTGERHHAIVRDEVHALHGLASELLDLSRPIRPVLRRQSLRRPLDEALLISEAKARARRGGRIDARTRSEADPMLPEFAFDERLLRDAIVHLVDNALEATGFAGDISVVAAEARRPSGSFAVVRVDDDGPGVPEGERERVFEPFHTRKSGRAGLGLAMARRWVEATGGTLRCEAGPAGGARFVIELPIPGVPGGAGEP